MSMVRLRIQWQILPLLPLMILWLSGCKGGGDDLGTYSPYGCNDTLASQKVTAQAQPEFDLYSLSGGDRISVEVHYACLQDHSQDALEIDLMQFLGINRSQLGVLNRRSEVGAHSAGLDEIELAAVDSLLASECVRTVNKETLLRSSSLSLDDPLFSKQYHFGSINLISSWGLMWSDSLLPTLPSKVVVAVIDSGLDTDHVDLVNNIWVNTGETAGNGIDDDGNGYIDDVNGYNFEEDIGNPDHSSAAVGAIAYHGTAVGGIIGAESGNSVGVSGVMGTQIQLMGLNVFGNYSGATDANIAAGIRYAYNNGADVINLSLGGNDDTPIIKAAIEDAIAAGAVVIASAGNASSDKVSYPAKYAVETPGLISVGASVSNSIKLAPYSSYDSRYVEIAAPGSDRVISSVETRGIYTTYPDDDYNRMDGTSSAAPVVAGAAALIISKARMSGQTLTPAEVESRLLNMTTAHKILSNKVQECRHLDFSKFQ